jgi:hypothetical protein
MRWAALLCLVGCGGGSTSYEDYQRQLSEARCEYFLRCGTVSSIADCHVIQDVFFTTASLDAAVAAGKVRYDGEAGHACLDAYAAASCDRTQQSPDDYAACSDAFQGTLAIGEACGFDGECVSDHCVAPSCPDACCQGTCSTPRVLPGEGQPCTSLCDGDLFCGVDSLCHAPLPEGAACDGASICDYAFYCKLTTTSSGVCTLYPQRGEACSGTCALAADYCLGGVCTKAGVGGEPCGPADECAYGYGCDMSTGLCALSPPMDILDNGASCTLNAQCKSHYCDDNNTCRDTPVCI